MVYTIAMSAGDLLDQIQKEIITSYAVRDSDVQETIKIREQQAEFFLQCLRNAVTKNDARELSYFIENWYENHSPEKGESLIGEISTLFDSVYKCSQAGLDRENSEGLLAALFPLISQSYEYINQQEFDQLLQQMNDKQTALEKLDKSKSDFISIAAHELKTPLTLLEGYTSMLRDIIEQKQIFDQHVFLLMDGMDSSSRRLREIINDMIDVSLIDNEMLSLKFQPTWIYKLLVKVELEFADVVNSRKMTLTINRFKGDDQLNYYDGERIFQAFSNVVSNAIKYTPDGGKVEIDGRKLDDYYELLVIDNGIGVDPINQTKIFSKLDPIGDISLHSSGKTKFKGGGPGLGLPIAKGIIEAHGGRIWVESEGYDEDTCPGSTFHLMLPLLTHPPEQAAEILFNPQFIHKSSSNSP